MQDKMLTTLAKAALAGMMLLSLQACSNANYAQSSSVAQAYESSGIVSSQPYTRTIFSSSNF